VVGAWIPGFAGEFAGMGLFTAVIVFLAAIPLFDPTSTWGKRARLTTWLGILVLAGMLGLTVWGYAAL
jgi:quinol-cytochrome oxidoreductase complex cytochrome b subunit